MGFAWKKAMTSGLRVLYFSLGFRFVWEKVRFISLEGNAVAKFSLVYSLGFAWEKAMKSGLLAWKANA